MKKFLISNGKSNRMIEFENGGELDRYLGMFLTSMAECVCVSMLAWNGYKVSRTGWSIEPFEGGQHD